MWYVVGIAAVVIIDLLILVGVGRWCNMMEAWDKLEGPGQ